MIDADLITQLESSAAAFCARAIPRQRLRALRAAGASFDRAQWRAMAELGWSVLALPEARGGLALGAAGARTVCRALGRVVAPEPLIETGLMAGTLLGSGAEHVELATLLDGSRIVTAPLAADAWQRVNIEAQRTAQGFALGGTLPQVALAADSDALLLPARCGGELGVFVVRADARRVAIEPLALADHTRDGRVTLDAVEVGTADCIAVGAEAEAVVAEALTLTGIGGSAYLLGLCEALLELTVDYTRTRRQFGRPIGSFQVLQHRLVDLLLQVRLTAATLDEAVAAWDARDPSRSTACARARHRAVETANAVIRDGIQLHGAIGYTEEADVALYVQRALALNARFSVTRAERAAAAQIILAPPAVSVTAPTVDPNYSPPDDDWNAVDDDLFQRVVRRWIEANYPAELRHYPGQVRWAQIRDWHAHLLQRGWAAPAWPREHGGMALAPGKLIVFIEELERWGVARAPDQGIVMIGPTLLRYGTAEQRARFLRPALTGEHIWCQGYSEPNAGSDLASLTTRAELHGDEFVVTGQKTWTTHALDATHMYCLVRTDPAAKPQAGISFLLIDLAQPGVTVRPIRNLGGDVDFCEVFLDGVRAPRANLVGELNQGWTIAKALLGFERLFVGSPKLAQHALNQLRELAQATGQDRDPVFVDAFARSALDVGDLEALYAGFAAQVKRGEPLGHEVALLKIWATETYVRLSEMIVEAAGTAGGRRGPVEFGGAAIDVLSHFYQARPAPIYAGSNEIQRNIIAKQVFGLPS